MRKITLVLILFCTPILQASDQRIVNGKNVVAGVYPWMVELRAVDDESNSFSRICGASLIHPQWVLTAAHCVADEETGKLNKVSNFEIKLKHLSLSEDGEVIKIKRILLNTPAFSPQTLDYDIALLELAQAATQPTVNLLSSKTSIPEGTQAVLTGWGRLAEGLMGILTLFYQNDPRTAGLDNVEIDNDILKLIDLLVTTAGIPKQEIIKVLLSSNQTQFKTETDTVQDFLNKVILENTPGFKALANQLKLPKEGLSFDVLYQALIEAKIPFEAIIYIIDISYGYDDGYLQQISYPIVSNNTCNRNFFGKDTKLSVTDNMLCTSQKDGKSDCNGDSGGPLVVWNGELGKWAQVGIVSWSELCSKRDGYDVYTRVSRFQKFIQKYVPEVQFVEINFSKMAKCVKDTTPIPFAPQLEINIQGKQAKAFWLPVSNVEHYSFVHLAYSNPFNASNFQKMKFIDMGSKTQITATLASGTDLYIAVQASNCSGNSEYSNLARVKIK